MKDDDDRRSPPAAPRTAVGVRPGGARSDGAGGDDGGPRDGPADPRGRRCPGLDAKVNAYVDGLMAAQIGSPEMAGKADDIRLMGDADIRAAADTSNRLLQMPVKELREGGVSGTSQVSKSLLDLRKTVESLDPSEATIGKKLLGLIPFGDSLHRLLPPVRELAEADRRHRPRALQRPGRAAQGQRGARTWRSSTSGTRWPACTSTSTSRSRWTRALSTTIAELDATDPARAKALREDVLFYVRQKHQDLLTQLAVSIQGYLAIDIIIKNNIELIKGVDRATTTTVAALRTAVIVAQALNNQRLVLDQITALNTTTTGPDRVDRQDAQGAVGGDPGAGRAGHRRAAAAAAGVLGHLRDDGLHRHVQGQGARLDGDDHRRARDRDDEGAHLPRPRQACGHHGRRQRFARPRHG